jgi:hypothetical protein
MMFVSSDRQKIVTTQSDTIMRYDANVKIYLIRV